MTSERSGPVTRPTRDKEWGGMRGWRYPPIIFRWDLDKTYLDTDLASFRALVRAPFERARDKIDVPGVAPLIKALKRSAGQRGQKAYVFFLTASPPQMGRAIKEKLAMDGVEVDGIVFKDQLRQLVTGRFRYLREQVGFKLAELLRARIASPKDSLEVLFGDDWESDALAYSLYADFLAGRLSTNQLRSVLERLRVDPARVKEIDRLAPQVPVQEAVMRIFIHLTRRSPPRSFDPFGPRLVPSFNYFQAAAVLTQDGFCDLEGLSAVAGAVRERAGYSAAGLANSLADLKRRKLLAPRWYYAELGQLARQGMVQLSRGKWRARWWRSLARWGLLGRQRSAQTLGSVVTADVSDGAPSYLPVVDAWTQGGRQYRAR